MNIVKNKVYICELINRLRVIDQNILNPILCDNHDRGMNVSN